LQKRFCQLGLVWIVFVTEEGKIRPWSLQDFLKGYTKIRQGVGVVLWIGYKVGFHALRLEFNQAGL